MTENTPQNSPIRPKSIATPATPGDTSPSQLQSTAQKQEQLLNRHRETNERLTAFKKKTEDGITAHAEKLETERQKTVDVMQELAKRHGQNLKTFTDDHEKQLRTIAERPLFDSERVAALSSAVSGIRAQNMQLRTQFTVAFASFLEEFKANKIIALRGCDRSMQMKLTESADSVKARIAVLQRMISERCAELTRTINQVSATPHVRLETSSVIAGESNFEVQQRGEHKRILRLSDFLSNWFIEHTRLLFH